MEIERMQKGNKGDFLGRLPNQTSKTVDTKFATEAKSALHFYRDLPHHSPVPAEHLVCAISRGDFEDGVDVYDGEIRLHRVRDDERRRHPRVIEQPRQVLLFLFLIVPLLPPPPPLLWLPLLVAIQAFQPLAPHHPFFLVCSHSLSLSLPRRFRRRRDMGILYV